MREYLFGIIVGVVVVTLFASVAMACPANRKCCDGQSACGVVACGGLAAICNCCYCGSGKYICGDTSLLPNGCHDASLCGPSGS